MRRETGNNVTKEQKMKKFDKTDTEKLAKQIKMDFATERYQIGKRKTGRL